jgi:hypothetical protein
VGADVAALLRRGRGIGADGVAGGDGEVGRESVEREPANLFGFMRLTVERPAANDVRKEGGRNPVLMLAGNTMFSDTKQGLDGDIDSDFFAGFADSALLERFKIVELAADDAPVAGLGRQEAESEQSAAALIIQ